MANRYTAKDPATLEVLEHEKIDRRTVSLTLKVPEEMVGYQAGDVIAVKPDYNSPYEVEALLRALVGNNESLRNTVVSVSDRGGVMFVPLHEALRRYLSLKDVTRPLVEYLNISGDTLTNQINLVPDMHVVDVLNIIGFKPLTSAEQVIGFIEKLKPISYRQYTIATGGGIHGNKVGILVSVVNGNYTYKDPTSEDAILYKAHREGACSTYFQGKTGDRDIDVIGIGDRIRGYMISKPALHVGPQLRGMVLISAGVGVAYTRSITEQKKEEIRSGRLEGVKIMIIDGGQKEATAPCYKELQGLNSDRELVDKNRGSLVQHVEYAESQGVGPKVYVQDILALRYVGMAVEEVLQGAAFCLCGLEGAWNGTPKKEGVKQVLKREFERRGVPESDIKAYLKGDGYFEGGVFHPYVGPWVKNYLERVNKGHSRIDVY